MRYRVAALAVGVGLAVGVPLFSSLFGEDREETWRKQLRLARQIEAAREEGDHEALRRLYTRYLQITAALGGDDPAGILSPRRERDAGDAAIVPRIAPVLPERFDNRTPVPIPDDVPAGATSTLAVTGVDDHLWDVDLWIDIPHTSSADLAVTLTSPSGTTIKITEGLGGSNDNVFAGTRFDDQATQPVTTNTFANNVAAPWLIPIAAMGRYVGENPNGTWTLAAVDQLAGDTGTIRGWSLYLSAVPRPVPRVTRSFTDPVPVAIPDSNPGGITKTLAVSGVGSYLCDLDLIIHITHVGNSDLTVTLFSPYGSAQLMTRRNGSSHDNVFNGTRWDDSALSPVKGHPFTDNVVATHLVPEGAMSHFTGQDPNGNWNLRVVDDIPGDTGSVSSWSLDVSTCEEPLFDDDFETGGLTRWSAHAP